MQDAQGMGKAGVDGAGVNERGQAKLIQVPQTLEGGGIHKTAL